ncbi:MAG: hypothetical protein APF84_02000 [Gracilibacter sp. BRH_c7a]|nr:MAG: hypothetical protein APF84_02000 [Gracilibacter sp. BRH_c7a]
MKKNEDFKDWLRENLQEETKEIYFSEEARNKVRESMHMSSKPVTASPRWWNKRVSLPRAVVSFCLAGLLLLTAVYTRTFFYVSPQEIARLEAQPIIFLHNGNIPFGALQHQVTASLEKDKGVGKP